MSKSDEQFFESLGKRLFSFRKAKGMTQANLAELIDVEQTSITYYENGQRRISLVKLRLIAKAFGVSLQELLQEEAEPLKPGPSPKLQRQIEQIANLPRSKQKFASDMLETILQSND